MISPDSTRGADRCLWPRSLAEARDVLADSTAVVLAGGTDLPARPGPTAPHGLPVVGISRMPGFRSITQAPAATLVHAGTTWADLLSARLPEPLRALRESAATLGSAAVSVTCTWTWTWTCEDRVERIRVAVGAASTPSPRPSTVWPASTRSPTTLPPPRTAGISPPSHGCSGLTPTNEGDDAGG
ncbi:hypothetical protein ACIRQQ_34515 [Streptomyces fuscichromogenes]|uniref:hypothetical protein n=1 Tax=Streptomyces fuscichromogenes TaxID=1324013 RepID=UPI003805A37E